MECANEVRVRTVKIIKEKLKDFGNITFEIKVNLLRRDLI